MLRDDIVDYIKRYAASFDPPYRARVEVQRITVAEETGRFTLTTSDGVLTARNLVITVGTHQHPNFPEWHENLPDGVTSIHTRDYRNAEALASGAVFIVGSGQSGCQVAEDLHLSGRNVHLAVGNAGRIPRGYRGRTIDLRRMALDGIQLHGKVLGIEGGCFRLSGDLAETLVGIDEVCRDEMEGIDKFIEESGLDDPKEEVSLVDWLPEPEPALLGLSDADVSTVIYATGFHFDFTWIDLPVLDERGYPRYARGVTEIPGLYFCGLHWMHTQGSGLFYGVGEDAEYVVTHLLNRIDS